MDSVTQVTLGAAVGEAVAGQEAGKKAPLWGAALGTLPDLDVLANPFLTEAQSLLFHRSASHSLLLTALLTPLLGLLFSRLHTDGPSRWRWAALVGSVLLTHIGLDCLTSYGTQIFWPFSNTPVIIGSIFIIDPFYTVPLAAGLLTSLWWSRSAQARRWANYLGLGISSAYLILTLANKLYVEHVFADALQAQNHPSERVFTKPTAFNNLLWMGISEAKNGFYIGYYSLLDSESPTSFEYVPKRHHLLDDASDNRFVERLRWFSRGYFTVRKTSDGPLTVQDLRFGRSDLGLTDNGKYIFTFELKYDQRGTITGFDRTRPDVEFKWPLLRRFLQRIGGDSLTAPSPDARPAHTRP